MSWVRSPFLRNSLIAIAAVAGTVGWMSLDNFAQTHGFLINRTPSLPNWAYFFERGKRVERGEIAFFMPPSNSLVRAHFGAEPPAFGKIVYGMPGDKNLASRVGCYRELGSWRARRCAFGARGREAQASVVEGREAGSRTDRRDSRWLLLYGQSASRWLR